MALDTSLTMSSLPPVSLSRMMIGQLAYEIAGHLNRQLGRATVSRFADGEVNVMVHDNVRGKDVYIIQVWVGVGLAWFALPLVTPRGIECTNKATSLTANLPACERALDGAALDGRCWPGPELSSDLNSCFLTLLLNVPRSPPCAALRHAASLA